MTFSKIIFKSARSVMSMALGMVLVSGLTACKKEEAKPIEAQGEAARDRYGVLNATFYVDKVGASTTETLGYNSWGFPNKKKFNFRACFRDQLLRGALQNWNVVILDGTTQKMVQTDFGGCANWSEVYSFDYFAPESYIEVTRTFNVTGGHKGDVKVVMGVNPWNGDVVDLRYDEIEEVTPNAAGPTTFTATMSTSSTEKAVTDQKEIGLTYQGHAYNDFEVDDNLSLTVAHYYQVEFSPTIFRRTLAKEKAGTSPDQGLVRVKALLLKDDPSHPDLSDFANYVTSFDQVFSIDNGSVKQQMVLKFPDIKGAASRMKALVRVEPIVDSPSVVPANFEGYLGTLPGGSFDLKPTTYDVAKLFTKFQEEAKERSAGSGIGYLVNELGFRQITPEEMEAAAELYSGCTIELCLYEVFRIATRTALMSHIYGAPQNQNPSPTALDRLPYLAGNNIPMIHADAWIVEKNAPVSVEREGITMAAEVMQLDASISRSEGQNSSFTLGFGLGADFGINWNIKEGSWFKGEDKDKPGPVSYSAGAGFKVSASQSWSYARAVGRAKGVGTQVSFQLRSRAQEFKIKTRAHRCLIFTVRDNIAAENYNVTYPGTIYCDEAQDVEAIETYYYVDGGGTDTDVWTDGSSLAEKPWLMFVRGKRQLGLFRDLVSRKGINLSMVKINMPRDHKVMSEAVYERINQEFPGMISGAVTVLE